MKTLRNRDLDRLVIREILYYARRVTDEGLVANTLGTASVKVPHPREPGLCVAYTKRAGIGLDRMTKHDIVVTSIPAPYQEASEWALLYGDIKPSLGHKLNSRIYQLRPDVSGVFHVHAPKINAVYSVLDEEHGIVSNDYPLVINRPPKILPADMNVELDVTPVEEFIDKTDVIVLRNHGITTLGSLVADRKGDHRSHLSYAFNRLLTMEREAEIYMNSVRLAKDEGKKVSFLSDDMVKEGRANGPRVLFPFEMYSPSSGTSSWIMLSRLIQGIHDRS